MRPVLLSSFFEKRLLRDSPQSSSVSTSRFARVFETFRHTSQASAPPVRARVQAGSSAALLASTITGSIRTAERLPPAAPRLATRSQPQPVNTSVQKQVATSPTVVKRSAQALAPAQSRATVQTYGNTITVTARQSGVDPALSLAVARAESGISAATEKEVVLNPRAVSSDGSSFGLFQLTDATGKEQLEQLDPQQTYNPFNPLQNIRLGVNYLKELSQTFSSDTPLYKGLHTIAGANEQEVRRLTVAAYNAGPGRVARAQARVRAQGGNPAQYQNVARYLPKETRRYVERVEHFTAEFHGHPTSASFTDARQTTPTATGEEA